VVVAAGAATALGLLVAYLSHNRYLQSALRHLLVASAATLATFTIGSLFDVAAA
jgi:VIT1/CCC1 family predicted Fe2+/Mn2+ transporter